LQYKDFCQWQADQDRRGQGRRQLEQFWLTELQDYPRTLHLTIDFPRPETRDFKGEHFIFTLDAEATQSLKKLVSETNTTLFIVLLALCNVWLGRLSGGEDILLGTPVEGRRHADLNGIIGMFVNTLVLRNYPSLNRSFIDFVHEVKERTLQAFDHQDFLFEDLVHLLSYKPEPGRNPVFDVLFTLQNLDMESDMVSTEMAESISRTRALHMKPVEFKNPVAKFDLMLTAREFSSPNQDGEIQFSVEYAVGLFKRETIERLVKYFKEVIQAVIQDVRIKIADIRLSHQLKEIVSQNPDMELDF